MAISFTKVLGTHEQALHIRSAKATLIAGNIANADTPHYKARDIDFSQALQQSKNAVTLQATNTKHFGFQAGSAAPLDVQYRVPTQGSFDGNTVDMDMEKAAFSENSIRYLSTLKFLSGRIQTITRSIRGE
jgi:flagellar basal-body rod protein FlgB